MFVLVNLKAYDCDPIEVGEAAASVAADTGVRVAVAPQASDISAVAATGAETWAQHVSPVGFGSHTGSTVAERVANAGAAGTLLNHSERQVTLAALETALGAAEAANLETVVCAETPTQVRAVTALSPDAVAVEPPELIGTGTSVSRADPDVVSGAVTAAGTVDESVAVYCGAGIDSGEDIRAAADLGADGVLLASGVAAAPDPETALTDLITSI